MKKFLLFMMAAVMAVASKATENKVFDDMLLVTINGAGVVQEAQVVVEYIDDENINFVLKNFALGSGEEAIYVGNINIQNLSLIDGTDGEKTFSFSGEIVIEEGDAEGVDFWFGPLLGNIPVIIDGYIKGDKLYVNIEIDMMSSLGQIIHVEFGFIASTATGECTLSVVSNSTESSQNTGVIVDVLEKMAGVHDDDRINLTIRNIVLKDGADEYPLGNLTLYMLPLTGGAFSFDGDVVYTDGDKAGVEWLAGDAEDCTLTITGTISGNTLTLTATGELGIYISGTSYPFTVNYSTTAGIGTGIHAITIAPESNAIYDLSGRCIGRATKGINIVNGKKIMINK